MLNARLLKVDSLLVGRPEGVLQAETAWEMVEFIERKEVEVGKGFNRFCDMTRLQGIQLTLQDIESFAARRRAFTPNTEHVKSAFLVNNPLAYGIVHLYRALLESERIEIKLFRSVEKAAEWLNVTPEKLSL